MGSVVSQSRRCRQTRALSFVSASRRSLRRRERARRRVRVFVREMRVQHVSLEPLVGEINVLPGQSNVTSRPLSWRAQTIQSSRYSGWSRSSTTDAASCVESTAYAPNQALSRGTTTLILAEANGHEPLSARRFFLYASFLSSRSLLMSGKNGFRRRYSSYRAGSLKYCACTTEARVKGVDGGCIATLPRDRRR